MDERPSKVGESVAKHLTRSKMSPGSGMGNKSSPTLPSISRASERKNEDNIHSSPIKINFAGLRVPSSQGELGNRPHTVPGRFRNGLTGGLYSERFARSAKC